MTNIEHTTNTNTNTGTITAVIAGQLWQTQALQQMQVLGPNRMFAGDIVMGKDTQNPL